MLDEGKKRFITNIQNRKTIDEDLYSGDEN